MATPAARGSLLIVDDYEDAREMYAEYFAAAGYDVATAGDGEEALAKATSARFDAVILDLALPRMDGIQVIEGLRKDSATGTLPILVLSASAGPEMRRAAMEAGADLYLYKPCLPDELEAALRRFLEQEPQRRTS